MSETAPAENLSPPHYDKIGGWLILLGINLVFAPLSFASFITNNLLPWLTPENQLALAAKHPLAPTLILGEIAVNVFFIACLVFLNIMFFQKRKRFPQLMITYRLLHLFLLITDQLLIYSLGLLNGQALQPIIVNVVGNIVFGGILIAYLLRSKRVKATFIH